MGLAAEDVAPVDTPVAEESAPAAEEVPAVVEEAVHVDASEATEGDAVL